jgi:hypothetical protein
VLQCLSQSINQSILIISSCFLPIALMTTRNQLVMPINVFCRRFHFFVSLCVSLLYAYSMLYIIITKQ